MGLADLGQEHNRNGDSSSAVCLVATKLSELWRFQKFPSFFWGGMMVPRPTSPEWCRGRMAARNEFSAWG